MPRPSFLLTAGQRKQTDGRLDLGDLEAHYRAVASGLYTWSGLPDGCPSDFIEGGALFYSAGAGVKDVAGMGPIVCPIRPATLDIYGRPYEWIPEPMRGMMPVESDADIFAPSSGPCLWLGCSVLGMIAPYLDIMARALQVLNTNIFALSQPIMISGLPGSELKGLIMKSEIMDGQTYIPIASRTGPDAEVLDLKATDHSQNLISTIDWCDARILELMASSNGVEKSSGITTMETVSGVQSVIQQVQAGLELRRAWCEDANDAFGLGMTVEIGAGIRSLTGGRPQSDAGTVTEAEL